MSCSSLLYLFFCFFFFWPWHVYFFFRFSFCFKFFRILFHLLKSEIRVAKEGKQYWFTCSAPLSLPIAFLLHIRLHQFNISAFAELGTLIADFMGKLYKVAGIACNLMYVILSATFKLLTRPWQTWPQPRQYHIELVSRGCVHVMSPQWTGVWIESLLYFPICEY